MIKHFFKRYFLHLFIAYFCISESQPTADADSTPQSHTTSSPTCTRVLCTTTIIVTLLITGIACAGYFLDVNSMLGNYYAIEVEWVVEKQK